MWERGAHGLRPVCDAGHNPVEGRGDVDPALALEKLPPPPPALLPHLLGVCAQRGNGTPDVFGVDLHLSS